MIIDGFQYAKTVPGKKLEVNIRNDGKNYMKNKMPKHPITCKCGKYWGKPNQGKYCSRCKTKVTFKIDHNHAYA